MRGLGQSSRRFVLFRLHHIAALTSAPCLKRTCAKVMSNVRFTLEADIEGYSKEAISHSQHETPNSTQKKTSA